MELPDTVLLHVLSFVNEKELVFKCSLVCKTWKRLIDSQTLWRTKCERAGFYSQSLLPDPPGDFREYFFQNPYNRNLIKNPCALDNFNSWKIQRDGSYSDHFAVEDQPCGNHPLENFTNIKGPYRCWVSSDRWCEKYQIIDLIAEGCSPKVLNEMQPDIKVSEWYAARYDHIMEYHIKVKLLDGESKVLDKWSFSVEKPAGRDWFKVEHIFTSYPKGVRFIKFQHRGKASSWQSGHFGSKFTMASVRFLMHRCEKAAEEEEVQSDLHYSSTDSEPEYDSDSDEYCLG